ncbi:MAG TPA: tetratricopeptide repeat protein [Patescibacteria group bacterium]
MTTKKLVALLIGITLFAYVSSLNNPFIWDDEQFIQKNVYVQNFDVEKIFTTNTVAGAGLESNYYRPLTSLSFAIDTKLWGQNPFGFHITNFLLHVGAGIILFFVLQQLGLSKLFSFAVSSIFLVHPIQTEAITYINSRGDSQYTFFFFLSLLVFLHAISAKKKRVLLYILSIVSYVLSIFSKETAMAGFLVFIGIIGFHYVKTKKIALVSILMASVITVISVGYFLLRLTLLNFNNTLNFYNTTNFYSTHLFVRLFTFTKVVWIYIGLLLFPYPLHMEREVGLVTSFISGWVAAFILLIIGLIILIIWEIKKYKTAVIGLGFLLSASFLVPVSGIIPINGILYEHWLYIPMVGFFIILFRLIQIAAGLVGKAAATKLGTLGIMLLCCICVVLTIRQNNIWSDPLTFYTYTLGFAPNSSRLHNNLGMTYADAGHLDASIVEYKKAIALTPDLPQVYNNLGISYQRKGDVKNAEVALQKSLSLAPHFEAAQINLMALYLKEEKYAKALPLLQALAPYSQNDVRFLYTYGKTLWKLQQYDAAEKQFDKAVAASGNNADVIAQINQLKASR